MPIKFKNKGSIQYTWLLLQQTNDSLFRCYELALAKTKLTPQQFSVIDAINNIGDPVLPTDIAQWLDRGTNTMTLMIDRMEKDGLISRVRDLKDRRAMRLLVSPLGKKLYDQAVRPSRNVAKNILSVLNQEELDTLDKLFEKVRQKSFEYREVDDKVMDENNIKKNRPELASEKKGKLLTQR